MNAKQLAAAAAGWLYTAAHADKYGLDEVEGSSGATLPEIALAIVLGFALLLGIMAASEKWGLGFFPGLMIVLIVVFSVANCSRM